jgi:hypothetical protein
MKKCKITLTEKTRKTVHLLSGIVAVISLVVTILLSPIGESFFNNSPTPEENKHQVTKPHSEHKAKKSYTFFLDKRMFSRSVNEDTTTIRAIKNNSIKMTITPHHGTSYLALCNSTKESAEEIYEYSPLNVNTLYSVYRTKADDKITTIYCVDDGLGSSIEIKYTYPSDDEEIKESFDILLSMFKLI